MRPGGFPSEFERLQHRAVSLKKNDRDTSEILRAVRHSGPPDQAGGRGEHPGHRRDPVSGRCSISDPGRNREIRGFPIGLRHGEGERHRPLIRRFGEERKYPGCRDSRVTEDRQCHGFRLLIRFKECPDRCPDTGGKPRSKRGEENTGRLRPVYRLIKPALKIIQPPFDRGRRDPAPFPNLRKTPQLLKLKEHQPRIRNKRFFIRSTR